MNSTGTPRHFLNIDDFDYAELRGMLNAATSLKTRLKDGDRPKLLEDKVLAMIFERQSTRTRVSFDVGMRQLGGQTIMLSGNDMQLSREETLTDTGRVMSRYVDAIMIRILSHADLVELSEGSSVPVINGLTRRAHPCQVMADLLTFEEHRGKIKGAKVAWVGDSNNVLHSWVNAAELFECELTIAVPDEYHPEKDLMLDIEKAGKWVKLIEDPREAVENADLVLTGRCRATAGLETLPGQHQLDELGEQGRPVHALPARPSRRRGDRRSDRWSPVGGV